MTTARPIAVLGGTGPEGFGLALRWAQAGETVIIGSRDAERAQAAAEKIKHRASVNVKVSGMENSAACIAADLLVLTVPFDGHATLLKQLKPAIRSSSIVIDATVPLAASVGGRATRVAGLGSTTDRRIGSGRGLGGCRFSKCWRGNVERRRTGRLRCGCVQRRS